MSRWRGVVLVAVVLLVAAACGGDSEDSAGAEGKPLSGESFRFGTAGGFNLADVPIRAAFEALEEEQGLDAELIVFEGLSFTQVIAGQIDAASTLPQEIIAAREAGEDVKIFWTSKGNEWGLATTSDITDPSDLNGKTIARHADNDLTALLLQTTVEKYDIDANIINIDGSEARVAAMLQGEIDAAPVDTGSFQILEREAPGKFHLLVDYEEEDPGKFIGSFWSSRTQEIEERKEVYDTVVQYLVEYFEKAREDPEWVAEEAKKWLPESDPQENLELARQYAERNVFLGDMEPDQMQELFDTYGDFGLVEGEVPPVEEFVTFEFVDKYTD